MAFAGSTAFGMGTTGALAGFLPFGRTPLPAAIAQLGQFDSITVLELMRVRTWVRNFGHCHQTSVWVPQV